MITLGETYSSLQYLYRIPAQTIGKIVPETCEAIAEVLKNHLQVNITNNKSNVLKLTISPISFTSEQLDVHSAGEFQLPLVGYGAYG